MNSASWLLLAANVILVAHVIFVAFVVFGLGLILLGGPLRWRWVRNPWFRTAHLVAIGIVILESWFGVMCPLTEWEMDLRERVGEAVYSGSFIAHWLNAILFYRAPSWVFTMVYTVFGALVAASWYWVRPRGFGKNHP